jgi:predicted SAM-dependent methyltransferase
MSYGRLSFDENLVIISVAMGVSTMQVNNIKAAFKDAHPGLVRIIRLTRYELYGAFVSVIGRISPRSTVSRWRLRKARGLRLHIASGNWIKPGWVNIDVTPSADIRIDIRKGLPLSNGSAELIFCEHFCDHISYPENIRRFLAECHRVLEPGGRARFVLHDGADLMRAYVERDQHYFATTEEPYPTMIEIVNLFFRMNDFHQYMYDYDLFRGLLLKAGFSQVIRCSYQKSEIPELILDFAHPSREIVSMYVEAVR